MNFSEVTGRQSHVTVAIDLIKEVEKIIPRDTHITFMGKYDGKDLSSPEKDKYTFPSIKKKSSGQTTNNEIQLIGKIVSTYNVQPGDLIIFEKREDNDNIYIDCIKRDNVISVLRWAKNIDPYEILNDSVLDKINFPVKAMFDGGEYSLSIKKVGNAKKRTKSKSKQALRTQYEIKIGNKHFYEVIPNMDDFNIYNINDQYVIEKNIKNKIVEIEYE